MPKLVGEGNVRYLRSITGIAVSGAVNFVYAKVVYGIAANTKTVDVNS